MNNLFNILKKNFKILIRSKSSALVIILGPLLLVLLLVAAFNTASSYNLAVATHSGKYSELTKDLINLLEEDYAVVKSESIDECILGVKDGRQNVCIVFPEDLSLESESKIELYVDYSRINIAYLVLDKISSKISVKSFEISKQLAGNLIDVVAITESETNTNKNSVSNLISTNEQSSSDINKVVSDLNAIDLTFNKDEITTLINDIKETVNNSNTSIGDLAVKVNSIMVKLEGASQLKTNSLPLLTNTGSSIDNTKSSLTSIKNSLDKILSSISGLEIRESEKIVSPITTKINPVTSSSKLTTMFPTFLIILIMFVAVFLASTIIIEEKVSNAFFRNYISPSNAYLFMFANYLTCLFVLILQLVLIVGIVSFFFEKSFLGILFLVSIALIVISTTFIFLGMFIGYVFKSEETSNIGAVSICSILLFFSNTILPLELLPASIKKLADFNPFVLADNLLRRIIIFESNFSSVSFLIYSLLAYTIIFIILMFIFHYTTIGAEKLKVYYKYGRHDK